MLDIEGFRKAGYVDRLGESQGADTSPLDYFDHGFVLSVHYVRAWLPSAYCDSFLQAAVDQICDYYTSLAERDVVSSVEPGYLKKEHIQESLPPTEGEKWDVIAADFNKAILPGITHWQHPKFTAYFPANASFESILADMFTGAVSNPGFNWSCSPACTELEMIVTDWSTKMFGLDKGGFLGEDGVGGGCIMGSASEACLTIAIGARERCLLTLYQQELKSAGQPPAESSEIPDELRVRLSQKLVMYGSTQTHSIGAKAASILGHKFRALEVARSDNYALRGETVKRAFEEDIAKGLIPFMVVASVGTTSSGAVDAVEEIGPVVREFPTVHLHIDAAWAGMMLACPELRDQCKLDAINEFAGSFSSNFHKIGLTNFDCTGCWVKDRTFLTNALTLTPEFLKTKHQAGEVIDYRNWNLSLGRRFRSLKLWFVLRSFGISGFQNHLRKACGLIDKLAEVVSADPDFSFPAPPSFALLTFRLTPPSQPQESYDAINRKLYDRINNRKDVLLTQTVLPEVGFSIRLALGTPSTQWEHVEQVWQAVKEEADAVLG